jgi:hypothetical protein
MESSRVFAETRIGVGKKKAAEEVSKQQDHGKKVSYGVQPWSLGASSVFCLPSASGANRDERPARLDGRHSRLEIYEELAHELKEPSHVNRGD